MTDKNIFDIYGGLDTRESYGNESSILSYTKAKNIDIDGKVVRRARGQTQVSIAPSGSTWAGIAPAPGGFIGGVNNDGKYYRTDPVTLISTPVYSGIINMPLVTPTNLSGVYNEDDNTISLTWTNENGTDVDIEIWHSTDGEEYTLLATSPTGEWTYTAGIPTGYVDEDITADHHYYKVRAVNATKQSDFSNVWDYPQRYLYCGDCSNGVISKISLSTFTVVDTLGLGSHIFDLWGDSKYLYCNTSKDEASGVISKISLSTFTVVSTVNTGSNLAYLWGDSKYLYSSNFSNHVISKISLSTLTVVDTVDIGYNSTHLWGDSKYLYCYTHYGIIFKISLSTFTVVKTLSVGCNVSYLWGDSKYLYGTNNTTDIVFKISLSTFTVVKTVYISSGGVYDLWGDSEYLYCCSSNGVASKISLSTFTVVDTVYVGSGVYFLWGDSE